MNKKIATIKGHLSGSRAKARSFLNSQIGVRGSYMRLSLGERILFTKRLGILLKAGVPIVEALRMLQKQTKSQATQFLLVDIVKGVEHGQFLHSCLEKFHKQFGDFAINVIRVGETSGTLHESLNYLAEELQKKRELKKKVVGALIYPAIIVAATLGISILLITSVFPKILPVLHTLKGDLPFTTRILIWTSNLFTTYGWLLAIIFVALVIGTTLLIRKSEKFRLRLDIFILKLPVIGKLFQAYHVANFCRTLGVLLKSEARIVETVAIAAKTSTNLAYKTSLTNLSEVILRGEKLSSFLENETALFPPMVYQMISIGESTGSLSDMLLYLAEIYEHEVDDMTKNLATAIEPALMIFMGILVGFIAMSIITPIYSLTQSLSK